jgi:hypothetical protein
LGVADWEDGDLRPAQANSSQDPIFKITRTKMVEHLLCKHEALSSNFIPTIKEKVCVGSLTEGVITIVALPPSGYHLRRREQPSPNPKPIDTLILDFPASRTVRNKFLSFAN